MTTRELFDRLADEQLREPEGRVGPLQVELDRWRRLVTDARHHVAR